MTEAEKRKQQYAVVVKSNELIRKSRFSLTLVEQRVVLYILSKIKPDDNETLEYDFNIKEFCEICGIQYGENLTQIKKIIKGLRDKSVWIALGNGAETTVSWIERPIIQRGEGTIRIQLDRFMMPYLLHLKGNFTKYELIATLALKNPSSPRLYELFKSYEWIGELDITVFDLKRYLFLENQYPKINDFKRYVLDKCIYEINTFTDIEISYRPKRENRSISGFVFQIQKVEGWRGEYSAAELYLNGELPSATKQLEGFKDFKNKNEEMLIDERRKAEIERLEAELARLKGGGR